MRPPDAGFADPRLARWYDFWDPDRSDLDVYAAIVAELGARRVVDIGCGTGSFAVRLAAAGVEVVGVDPAGASLDLARAKPYADRVIWLHGDATMLAGRHVAADLAVLTGNVAQVFVDDEDWAVTLDAVHDALAPGGWLVLETRRPEARAWQEWDGQSSAGTLPNGSSYSSQMRVTAVELPLVTFEVVTVIDGEQLRSESTLRFQARDEVEADLVRHGFEVEQVRDAPDRPGKELVFVARRAGLDTGSP